MYRSLNYSHPVEAYTGKQLTDLQTSTILRFTYEYSDYVAVMRQAALPIHNYMSKKAKHELVHSMLARQWGITSQVQFNGLGTQRVMRLLQVKATPRSLDEFYYSLKDNTEFPSLGEVEITISNFNKFYESYQQYRVYFEYVYVFLSQYCDPSCVIDYRGSDRSLKKLFVDRIPKDLGKKMLFGYNQQELKDASSIEELWDLLDSQVTQFFEQYEMHKQFDRRLVGDSKEKSKDIGKQEPYHYHKAADSKPVNSYNNKKYTSNYQKTSNTNANQAPPKKKYSNIGEVVVELDEDAVDEAEPDDNEYDEIDEYFGQMAPPKSDSRNASSSRDKIRPKSDNDLPDICFRWFWESSCKRKDCPYPHPEKITQAEIVGWKSFYKKLSQHRVKSAVDLLLPRLPEEQKKLHSIEANDTKVPMPKTDYSSSDDSA
jgi:hypothetical protein